MRAVALAMVIALCMSASETYAHGGSHGGGHGYRSSNPGGEHYVHSYMTKRGTFVEGHMQTNPNGTPFDNWSTFGNTNPYTGKAGTKYPYRETGGYQSGGRPFVGGTEFSARYGTSSEMNSAIGIKRECTSEELKIAQIARENGYQYHPFCSQ